MSYSMAEGLARAEDAELIAQRLFFSKFWKLFWVLVQIVDKSI